VEDNFIDEMLLEIEAKEQQMQLAHVDMVLKEISSLNSEITRILSQAEEEKQIITDWAIARSAKLNERAQWLTKKLEVFMNEQDPTVRTIDLAHGQLLRRKQVGKIVVENLDQFLQNENLSQLTSITPEVVKPDIAKIKAFYKMTGGKIPKGCNLIESSDKFSIKLKGGVNGTSKNGIGSEQTNED
jgi:phage host-nuclease inhibitor protein Gam